MADRAFESNGRLTPIGARSVGAAGVTVWWLVPRDIDPPTKRLCWAVLSREERRRAARFRVRSQACSYLAAHALVRMVLGALTGMAPAEVSFRRDERGKPQLRGPMALEFNISHTHGLVACAVSLEGPVGVDVERVADANLSIGVGQRMFPPSERALLTSAAEGARPEVFCRLWTLKEAFLKATGEGLRRSLSEFSFTLDPIAVVLDGESGEPDHRWAFRQERPTPEHILTVALLVAPSRNATFQCERVKPEMLRRLLGVQGTRAPGAGRRFSSTLIPKACRSSRMGP